MEMQAISVTVFQQIKKKKKGLFQTDQYKSNLGDTAGLHMSVSLAMERPTLLNEEGNSAEKKKACLLKLLAIFGL